MKLISKETNIKRTFRGKGNLYKVDNEKELDEYIEDVSNIFGVAGFCLFYKDYDIDIDFNVTMYDTMKNINIDSFSIYVKYDEKIRKEIDLFTKKPNGKNIISKLERLY